MKVVEEAVSRGEVDKTLLETATNSFYKKNGITDNKTLKEFITKKGITEEDLKWQISLPLLVEIHCEKEFSHKAEARFLERKNSLDKVVYSILRTKDIYLARELYLRITGGEQNFGDLASKYSEGQERNTKGIIGPVSLMQSHPVLSEKLRTGKPGIVIAPFRLDDWWIVCRLETYSPAVFDGEMKKQLSLELFNEWVNGETAAKVDGLTNESIEVAGQ